MLIQTLKRPTLKITAQPGVIPEPCLADKLERLALQPGLSAYERTIVDRLKAPGHHPTVRELTVLDRVWNRYRRPIAKLSSDWFAQCSLGEKARAA
jgi:hypothetical protein